MNCFAETFVKIDQISIGGYSRLNPDDQCFSLAEYDAGKGFRHSKANQVIQNLKKPMKKKPNAAEWKYKNRAIECAAKALHRAFSKFDLKTETIVPVPSSKVRGDPDFDDRLLKILERLADLRRHNANFETDVREVITSLKSTEAWHTSKEPRDPSELLSVYDVNSTLLAGIRRNVIIFDDVIATGGHFSAMKSKLLESNNELNISGVFLARSVRTQDEPPLFEFAT